MSVVGPALVGRDRAVCGDDALQCHPLLCTPRRSQPRAGPPPHSVRSRSALVGSPGSALDGSSVTRCRRSAPLTAASWVLGPLALPALCTCRLSCGGTPASVGESCGN